jgi:predicted GH43/DUF377 family glycosyl hydrolase
VRRGSLRLEPDPSRVTTRLFVPGREPFDHQDTRTTAVLARILALDDHEVEASFDDVVSRFGARHRDLFGTFRRHAAGVAGHLDPGCELSGTRELLLGATFTSEYAVEGAALCNPSIVAHPDQHGAPQDRLRVVLSVRAIGEGHHSSIGFRTGTVDADGDITLDPAPQFVSTGSSVPGRLEAAAIRSELRRVGSDGENADFVLGVLGAHFAADELEDRLRTLQESVATGPRGYETASVIRAVAERTYATSFPESTALAERVLMPAMSAESHGMEDARFVRFVDDDRSVSYYAPYTAYDGNLITQQVLETVDFCAFTSSPLVGPSAANKGLALFPRRIGGRFAALCRPDRETNMVAFSDSLHEWSGASPCQVPTQAWEVLQLGNCGSPIETEAGWLVLTHGVGPMRTYSIGAVLLDLEDPTHLVGRLREPILRANGHERDGYVPNVVYSCGALVHAGHLVLPYGVGDAAIRGAVIPVAELLDALERPKGQ